MSPLILCVASIVEEKVKKRIRKKHKKRKETVYNAVCGREKDKQADSTKKVRQVSQENSVELNAVSCRIDQ